MSNPNPSDPPSFDAVMQQAIESTDQTPPPLPPSDAQPFLADELEGVRAAVMLLDPHATSARLLATLDVERQAHRHQLAELRRHITELQRQLKFIRGDQ